MKKHELLDYIHALEARVLALEEAMYADEGDEAEVQPTNGLDWVATAAPPAAFKAPGEAINVVAMIEREAERHAFFSYGDDWQGGYL